MQEALTKVSMRASLGRVSHAYPAPPTAQAKEAARRSQQLHTRSDLIEKNIRHLTADTQVHTLPW